MPIAGQKMHDPNIRLRVLLLVFGGVVASAALLYWRSEYLVSQEYIDFPTQKHVTIQQHPHVPKGYEDLYK
jgi:uncharacterized protein involved in cysteine biosynthesis